MNALVRIKSQFARFPETFGLERGVEVLDRFVHVKAPRAAGIELLLLRGITDVDVLSLGTFVQVSHEFLEVIWCVNT